MKEEDEHGRKRSERTLRNYFMDLADISLTGHTRLPENTVTFLILASTVTTVWMIQTRHIVCLSVL
jgi:hypothetical protein